MRKRVIVGAGLLLVGVALITTVLLVRTYVPKSLSGAAIASQSERTLHTSKGEVAIETTTRNWADIAYSRRSYGLYNDDQVVMGSAAASMDSSRRLTLETVDVAGSSGTVYYYVYNTATASGSWSQTALGEQTIRSSCIIISLDGGGEYLFYTPRVYQTMGTASIQYQPTLDGTLKLKETASGYSAMLQVLQLPAGCHADYLTVSSPGDALYAWGRNPLDFWGLYTLDGDGKWCYDGYYFTTPSEYAPSGKNYYYRMVESYLSGSFAAGAQVHAAAEDLTIATLDTMSLLQNQDGFFPTECTSSWLQRDYGIGEGFYDTRFNTGLIRTFYDITSWISVDEFNAVVERYFAFYQTFAEHYHQETLHSGWLVEDYWSPTAQARTHTSLNHQVAELLLLFRYGDYFGRDDLTRLANVMLQAIKDTSKDWIRPDGNLYYAILSTGDMALSLDDYPYLTYNDLYELQKFLLPRSGRRDESIQKLLDAKLTWMVRAGVTGYDTSVD